MKKYLGSKMSVFFGLLLPIGCVFSIWFGINAVTSQISASSIFICIYFELFSIFLCYFIVKASPLFYSWGVFAPHDVKIKTLFRKAYSMEYSKCVDVGIAYYVHGVLNTNLGTKCYYIYLSYHVLENKYKTAINAKRPSKYFIKIGYRKKFYMELLECLPERQARMLRESHISAFGKEL